VTWITGIVLYALIWWMALFAVLPFGTKPLDEPDAQTGWRGTPERPLLLRKLIATTVVAAVLWAGCYALIASDLISFRHGWFAASAVPE
jgi:predicted secreted protein